jgi:hypothetical protein
MQTDPKEVEESVEKAKQKTLPPQKKRPKKL